MRPDAARIDALARLARGDRPVTLTVTEKGYRRRADTGSLDTAAPGVAADLAATAERRPGDLVTVVGRLTASAPPPVSGPAQPRSTSCRCDNMAGNGAALAGVVRGFVEASTWSDRRPMLDWLDTAVGFPDTIVDRIVPATTPGPGRRAAALGLRDELPVVGEPYRQWVLEDSFVRRGRHGSSTAPLFVADVAPYQLMKLRLLNGSHSALAYLGAAAGCRTVAEVMATGWGERLVRSLGSRGQRRPCRGWGRTPPSTSTTWSTGSATPRCSTSCGRSARTVAQDPDGRLDALRALRAAGAGTPTLELAVAAWVNATRPDGAGRQVFGTTDPATEVLARCWQDTSDPSTLVAAMLRAVGATDLAEQPGLTSAVAAHLPALQAGRVEI